MAVSFLAVSVSFGPLIVFTFGVFLLPLSDEFGWSRGEISLAFTIAALTVAFVSPMIGRLTDRFGTRPVVVFCASVYAACFASLSLLAGWIGQLYATYFAVGLVGNGATQLPYSRTITEWFEHRRGIALSLMMTGVGLGIVVMPPLAQHLINNYGWRKAYLVLGVLVFAIAVPLPALLLRRGPAFHATSDGGPKTHGATVRQALGSGVFWTILTCFFLQSAAMNGCIAHLAPLLTDRGLSTAEAAAAASVLGGFTMGARLATGWMLDRYFAPYVAAMCFALATAGVALLLAPTTQLTALGAAALIGASMGAEADIKPYLVSRYFGLRSFTELYGYAFSAYAVAGALGPGLMGFGFDRFGDYQLTITALAVTMAGASLLMLRLPRYEIAPGSGGPGKENLDHASHSAA